MNNTIKNLIAQINRHLKRIEHPYRVHKSGSRKQRIERGYAYAAEHGAYRAETVKLSFFCPQDLYNYAQLIGAPLTWSAL